ncbi:MULTISPECIES: hypothetical protein [Cupriavidus]|uniref:hypothetical protein n=1 Tax=Cupriavidus TaxID=106589 RepID=UPI0012E04AFB|nr:MULTISPECIES: hypothetical protein [Cupriavidus]
MTNSTDEKTMSSCQKLAKLPRDTLPRKRVLVYALNTYSVPDASILPPVARHK